MDDLGVLREKIESLCDEIAHGQRQERLQEIQQELVQLIDLGRRVFSVEQKKEEHRSRLHLVKKAS